jgi:hypothetical protein
MADILVPGRDTEKRKGNRGPCCSYQYVKLGADINDNADLAPRSEEQGLI